MTFPINIPKNHYKWGDYDGNVFEKNHTRNIWHHCLLEEKLIHASHMSSRERLDEITQLLNTWIHGFCYEVYYVPSDNGNVIPHVTETQSQVKSEGPFWSTPVKNDSMVIQSLITTV